MEELQNFNFTDLYEKLKMSDNDFDAWLEELGLLHAKKTCKQCGGRTTLKVENGHSRYTAWRCTTKNCRVSSGYLCGTFFERRHLTTKQVFELAYYWAQQFGTIKEIGFQTKISQASIIGLFDKFRDVCVKYLDENPIKIEEGIIDKKPDNRRRDNYKYQQELIWRTQFGDIRNVFYYLWKQISIFYPCERKE